MGAAGRLAPRRRGSPRLGVLIPRLGACILGAPADVPTVDCLGYYAAVEPCPVGIAGNSLAVSTVDVIRARVGGHGIAKGIPPAAQPCRDLVVWVRKQETDTKSVAFRVDQRIDDLGFRGAPASNGRRAADRCIPAGLDRAIQSNGNEHVNIKRINLRNSHDRACSYAYSRPSRLRSATPIDGMHDRSLP